MSQPSVERPTYNGRRHDGPDGHQGLSPEALRAEIARTRAALGDTTEALAERFDVPTRVRRRLRESRTLHDRPTLVAAAVAVLASVVAVWAFRQRAAGKPFGQRAARTAFEHRPARAPLRQRR
jgi:hypothetical protein